MASLGQKAFPKISLGSKPSLCFTDVSDLTRFSPGFKAFPRLKSHHVDLTYGYRVSPGNLTLGLEPIREWT